MEEIKERVYPVHEIFYTWQGEGIYMGVATCFVRLYGCPLHCPWCDSAGTWHKDYVPDHIKKMTAQDILDFIQESRCLRIVITGGEPGMFDLFELTSTLRYHGVAVHVETSGAFPLRGTFDWITVSPKWARLPLPENIERASELKIIVEHKSSINDWINALTGDGYRGKLGHLFAPYKYQMPKIWLHPEWSQRDNPEVLLSISAAVKEDPTVFRAGYQLHKLYKVDNLDPNASKVLVPLGGDPERGY